MDSLCTEGNGKQTYFPRAAPVLVVCWRDWFRSQVTWGKSRGSKGGQGANSITVSRLKLLEESDRISREASSQSSNVPCLLHLGYHFEDCGSFRSWGLAGRSSWLGGYLGHARPPLSPAAASAFRLHHMNKLRPQAPFLPLDERQGCTCQSAFLPGWTETLLKP